MFSERLEKRRWGVAGVPWALVIAYTLLVAIPIAVYVPRLLRHLSSVSNERLT